jgi:hypothetical protein
LTPPTPLKKKKKIKQKNHYRKYTLKKKKKNKIENIFELDGGINRGWIDKGLATTKIAANQGKPWYKIW